MKQKPVAVFDIDGTVFRSSLTLEVVERLIEKGIFPLDAKDAYEDARVKWLNRKGDYQEYVDRVVKVFRAQIKGVPFEAAANAAGEVIEEMKDRVYRYTRDLSKELKKKGYYLLAISHTPKFIVDGFGYERGFDKTYGYFFTSGASGNFTGEIEDEALMHNKAAILNRALRKENLTLAGSIAVGDTESDIPMLEAVETAIAFNPNKKLFDHAKRRGWKIVVERKDMIYEI
jgi:HAD superfamily hydrolase (TIGR01490 family)